MERDTPSALMLLLLGLAIVIRTVKGTLVNDVRRVVGTRVAPKQTGVVKTA